MAPNFAGRSFSDSNLIQGKNNYNCSSISPNDTTNCTSNAGLAKFRFQSGKTHRLRFINSGSQGTQRISIDEHIMTVIANDFVEIQPYDVSVITLGVGQRADVLVTAIGDRRTAIWLRASLTSCASANAPDAVAGIFYEDSDDTIPPTSQAWDVADPGDCANDPLDVTIPVYSIALPEATYTQNLDIGAYINSSGNYLWTFGNVSARVDHNNPTLLQAREGNFSFAPEMNVINYGSNSSVRLIINNPFPA